MLTHYHYSVIPTDSALSSSHNFGSRVYELLGPLQNGPSRITTQREPASTTEPSSHVYHEPILDQPTETEARRLVDAVNFNIGHIQSHYEPREFLDRMGIVYASQLDSAHTSTLWFLEMVLVLAVGKQFLGEFDEAGSPTDLPGMKLFDFAHRNLPTLSEQFSQGRLGVEIVAFMAVYLQNLDRKEEAYLYVSTGKWVCKKSTLTCVTDQCSATACHSPWLSSSGGIKAFIAVREGAD